MTTALLIISAVSLLLEIAGLLYCAIRNLPFGRSLGAAVFVQISIPAAFITVAGIWEHFSATTRGVDSLGGTGFGRGLHLYFTFLVAGFAATLAAGLLGLFRVLRGIDQ